MAKVEIEEYLAPEDGVSDYSIELARITPVNGTDAIFRFRWRLPDDDDGIRRGDESVLTFHVAASKDGLADMYARAHEELIDALRQALFWAEVMRKHYAEEADRMRPADESGA